MKVLGRFSLVLVVLISLLTAFLLPSVKGDIIIFGGGPDKPWKTTPPPPPTTTTKKFREPVSDLQNVLPNTGIPPKSYGP